MTKFIGALWCAILGLVSLAQAQEPVLIGRVVHIEGGVLRYVTAEDDWVGPWRIHLFGRTISFTRNRREEPSSYSPTALG